MFYSHHSQAKKIRITQKEKQLLNNHVKHSSFVIEKNPATSVYQILVEEGPELTLVPDPDCSLNGLGYGRNKQMQVTS